MKKNQKSKTEISSMMDFVSDVIISMFKPIQDRILGEIENSINKAVSRIVSLVVLSVLSLIGLVFILLGFVFWISAVSGFGLWFSFFVVGIALFFSIAIITAFNKRK